MEIELEYGENFWFEASHEADKLNEELFAKLERIGKSVEDLLNAA
jgi:hypothetical protein